MRIFCNFYAIKVPTYLTLGVYRLLYHFIPFIGLLQYLNVYYILLAYFSIFLCHNLTVFTAYKSGLYDKSQPLLFK